MAMAITVHLPQGGTQEVDSLDAYRDAGQLADSFTMLDEANTVKVDGKVLQRTDRLPASAQTIEIIGSTDDTAQRSTGPGAGPTIDEDDNA
jgi:hypothetical protein